MVKRVILLLLVFTFIFTSCVNDLIEYFDSESYSVRIVKSSELFEKYGNLSVSSYDRILIVRIKSNLPEKYFPKDSAGKKMNETRFYVALFPDIDTRYGVKDAHLITGKNHIFGSNIQSIENNKDFLVRIPLYDLFFVPYGKHKIYFKILQKKFYHKFYDEGKDSCLVWAIAETEIEIPEIYKTTLCTDSIILCNDDSFSPAGMDFSFRAGLPDIYWYFSYDAGNDNQFLQTFHSGEATYAILYPYKDTISFLHYKDLNKLNISVWDRDDFSKDDIIGAWEGNLEGLKTERGQDYRILKFDNVDAFKIRVLSEKVATN